MKVRHTGSVSPRLGKFGWQSVAALVLGFSVITYPSNARSDQATLTDAGDVLQVALPLAGAICAYRQQQLGSYAARFVGQGLVVHGAKALAGSSSINRRPNGGSGGIISGHTSAAFFGASYLSKNCVQSPAAKILIGGLAVFVGASRVNGNKHTIGQVIAGAVVGLAFQNTTVSYTGDRLQVKFEIPF